jgi:mono/diheme cytochrome c family protein
MAYSPVTGLVYLPVQDFASTFKTNPDYRPGPYLRASGLANPGAIPQDPRIRAAIPRSLAARLVAWNPVTQQEAWRVPYEFAGNGGVLATAGGIVFEGKSGGEFVAYEAASGAALWSFDAQATAQGGPVSYAVHGTQYIAIAIGNGGSSWLAGGLGVPQKKGTPTGRVVAFKLNGDAPYPRIDTALDPIPPPPALSTAPATLARGADQFAAYCAGCHGFGAISGFVTPDLRRSGYIQSREAFRSVVHDGALKDHGMPRFGDYISADDLETIRAFVASEAHYIFNVEHGMTQLSPAASPSSATPLPTGSPQ